MRKLEKLFIYNFLNENTYYKYIIRNVVSLIMWFTIYMGIFNLNLINLNPTIRLSTELY